MLYDVYIYQRGKTPYTGTWKLCNKVKPFHEYHLARQLQHLERQRATDAIVAIVVGNHDIRENGTARRLLNRIVEVTKSKQTRS
jgi:muramoyltetrapeptide carboxypeptidase LdcA involved in peptidoglycan recycling